MLLKCYELSSNVKTKSNNYLKNKSSSSKNKHFKTSTNALTIPVPRGLNVLIYLVDLSVIVHQDTQMREPMENVWILTNVAGQILVGSMLNVLISQDLTNVSVRRDFPDKETFSVTVRNNIFISSSIYAPCCTISMISIIFPSFFIFFC